MGTDTIAVVARLDGISKHFEDHLVLDDIALEVRAGEVTALLGPNGAGKTTCVGILTGRLAPASGRIELFGLDPTRPAARARMGVMLQSGGLPDVLTVVELVTLQSGYYRYPREVAATIALAGLEGLEARPAGKLSGGQQRRLHYALAICGRPDLLVLDEPTTGLDHEARRQLWTTVREEADGGAAVLLTTHYLEEADALADRIIVIDEGRIIADDAPAAIKARVAGSTIRCRTALSERELARLPGVRSIDRNGAAATLMVADGASTARALLGTDPTICDLTITAASLEDALSHLSSMKRAA